MSAATDIPWVDWGEAAFARARSEGRLVFLHIGATWCHWCHVMDQGSYTWPRVAEVLGARFVPVRVDTDVLPDVNERYNHGGWPTVAVLDADGEVLAGRTYLSGPELLALLQSFLGDGARRVVAPERPMVSSGPPVAVEAIAAAVRDAFDATYGGFGEVEKFPHVPVCEWLLDRHQRGDDQARLLVPTLDGMALRGMYDAEEGGWYRYATQDDWNVPHYEKLLEDNARLVALYARAAGVFGRPEWRRAAEAAVTWALRTLWRDDARAFAGSQDADEGYHARSLALREHPPAVDTTVFAGWNGLMVGALVRAGAAWGRPGLVGLAREVGETLRSRVDPDGRVLRAADVWGLLDDQVQVADAFHALGAFLGDPRWIEDARRVLQWARRHLAAPEGGLYDRVPIGVGRLRHPRRPLFGNAAFAQAAARHAALTGEVAWRSLGIAAADAALAEADGWGFMGAAAAAARERVAAPTVVVKLYEHPTLLDRFTAEAHPQVLARALGPEEAAELGLAPGQALPCTALACARLATTEAEVRRGIAMLLGSGAP